MSDRSATMGTFSDFKIIRSRKVAQIVVEIPFRSLRSLEVMPFDQLVRRLSGPRVIGVFLS
jgi:hypothetical protein